MPVENPDYEKLQILCEQLKQQNKQLIDENKNLSSKNLYEKDKKNEDNLQIKEEDNQSTSSSISSFGEDEFIDLDAQDLDDDDTWLVKPEVVDQAYTDSFATSMDYLLQDLNTPEKRAESRRKLEAFESPINYKKTGKSSSNYTPRMNESKTPCNANAFTPLNFSPESLLNETGGETIPATTDSPIALNAKHSTEAVSRFENTDFQASLETTDSSISPPTSDGINTRVSAALGDRDTVSTPTTATGDNVGTRGEAQRPRPSDYVNAVDGGEGESGSRSANKPSGQQPTTRRVLKLPTSRVVNPYAAEVNPRTLMYDLDMDGSSRPNEEYDEELSNINGEEKKTHQSPATRRTLAQFSCSSPSLAKPMTPTKHLETSNATLQTPQRSGLKAPVKSRLQLPMKAVRPLQQGLSASSTSAATCPSASTSCIPRTASTSKLPLPRRSYHLDPALIEIFTSKSNN